MRIDPARYLDAANPPPGEPSRLSDDTLMASVARREPAALRALFDRHAPLVHSLCQRILHDAPAAEEVTLDVFYELWQKCDRFDPARGRVLTYLATLARSRALDRLRSKISQHRADGRLPVESLADPALSAGPCDELLAAERREQVVAAIEQLEPGQRRAIELAYFEGLTQSEIAARLDKPLGTVKSWTRQGLIRLRDVLRIVCQDTGPS
ncbi:MAG: sigma-70 family RNA polymerase sigma factor [Tepidisphaeraceae bacterium]